jgi:HD-GYP domain-containing protein (c-di-GMP phosphodiesterase class II)
MERLQVPFPFLQSLDYFKNHDFYTYNHNLIVSALSTRLSGILISDDRDVPKNAVTSPTHDIGKICIPFHILNKSEPLTLDERSILEHHAVAGYILLSYYLRDPLNIYAIEARDHHERKDGSGYPQGIKLQNRIVEIVAVCDIYDALISQRPYRPAAFSNRTAIEALTEMAEKNVFGWETIKTLVALNRKGKPHYTECLVSKEKRGTPPQNNNYGVYVDDKDD